MVKLIFVFCALTKIAMAALPESLLVQGFDLRSKDEKYVLFIGPENSLLEERTYKLKKVSGKKEVIVSQGNVVSLRADPKKDMEALYANETVQIQIGRPVTFLNPQKQIIVFKVKNTSEAIGQTVVFENSNL